MSAPVTNKDYPDLPFWNNNLPPEQHTQECPPYLRYCFTNGKDRQMLLTPDHRFHRATWEEVQQVINDNRLDLFLRVPSQLRTYREYCYKLESEYGSVVNFVMRHRLQWTDLKPKGGPFESAEDYKILYNDWPYGIDERIVHLVVWTKFELDAQPVSKEKPDGDLTPEMRKKINEFVDETFVRECGEGSVLWFKNWSALKSIHAIEHFHVMLFAPSEEFVRRITNNDVPMAAKVGHPGEDGR